MASRERSAARSRLETQTWQALRLLVLERHDRRRSAAEELGMSWIRLKALIVVRPEPRTLRDLGAALGVDAPFTTVIVDDLERRGLVTRRPHPSDRRAKLVGLTPAGRETAVRAERMVGRAPTVMRELSDDDVATLHRIVAGLLGEDE